jgi:dipeptidyl aminopeptidase/acylaminoacyl peptidase
MHLLRPVLSFPPAYALAAAVLVTLPAWANVEHIKPGDNLVIEGIPALPLEIAKRTAPYTEFRPSRITAWHPKKRELLISTRLENANQIHRVAEPGAKPEPLTDFKDPVVAASYQPKQGNFFLFAKGSGGDEAFQISRLDLESRSVTPLSPANVRAGTPSWNHEGNRVVYTTSVLDRNNAGREARTELHMVDPEKPDTDKVIAAFEGGGWSNFRWSPDDSRLVFVEFKSANESHVWIMDVATGEKRKLTAEQKGEQVRYHSPRFGPDGKRIYATSDRGSEFQRLVAIDVATGKEDPLLPNLNWDVDEFTISKKSSRIAFTTNEDGVHALRFFDLETGKEQNRPALVPGVISGLSWNRSGEEIAFNHASARSAGDVFSWNTKEAKMTRWTNGASPEVNVSEFVEPKLIRWKSFDDRQITGFYYDPPERFRGKRPVIVNIHGGPESQSRAGFIGRFNYFVNELGVAVIFPNVRGSSGYGKTFLKLDNGKKREDSVKDIGALLDWIKQQPDLDPNRVLVTGGSYGGYMTLAVATLYPDRIAGAISSVGISNFVSFLQNTESYRRDLRRVEYGDERDPGMKQFLETISPLARADRIRKPLFVIQGKNDPRVPYTEAEQIVQSMKKRKAPVWFLMANDEGHGFSKKNNSDFSFYAQVKFIENTLLR